MDKARASTCVSASLTKSEHRKLLFGFFRVFCSSAPSTTRIGTYTTHHAARPPRPPAPTRPTANPLSTLARPATPRTRPNPALPAPPRTGTAPPGPPHSFLFAPCPLPTTHCALSTRFARGNDHAVRSSHVHRTSQLETLTTLHRLPQRRLPFAPQVVVVACTDRSTSAPR